MEKYFIIYQRDKEATVQQISKEKLERMLNEGELNYEGSSDVFLSMISDSDPGYWSGKVLIIKGEIIQPKAKKVVEKYEV